MTQCRMYSLKHGQNYFISTGKQTDFHETRHDWYSSWPKNSILYMSFEIVFLVSMKKFHGLAYPWQKTNSAA